MFLQLSGGGRLWYEQSREEPKLLFLGGLGMSSLGWRGVLGALSKPWGTLCVDFPGSGKSDLPAKELSMASLANLVVELLDFCGISRISPVGLSMGGFVALEMARSFPERVEKLVLINSASRLEGRGREQLALWEDLRRIGCPPELILRQQLLSTLSAAFFALPQRMEQSLVFFRRYQEELWQKDAGFYPQARACREFDFRDKAREIAAPALLVSGREDCMIPPESMAKLKESLPKSTLRILPGGHALHVEQAPEIARSLEDFFADAEEA
jgi:pimeloyl-ACP methyl ester carboxylesterase